MEKNNKLPKLSIGILAGGKSSRMGYDKALLKLNNESMLKRLLREFNECEDVYVSSAGARDYGEISATVIKDENYEIGPIEGIRRVLSEAANEYVFICAVDMPFVTDKLSRYIASFISSDYDCYVLTDDEHIHPLCAIYKKSVLPYIEAMIEEGNYRIRELFKKVPVKYISIEDSCFDKKVVRNVNTRSEYIELQKPFVFCVSGYSDSGKTFLIERLINGFIDEGFSVGVLKHDGHDVFEEKKGSDTQRFLSSGASVVSVFSDTRYSIHYREPEKHDEILQRMSNIKNPTDIIIIEGMKSGHIPKVVLLKENGKWPDPDINKPYICIATDGKSPIEADCPIFGRDDIRGLFLCIRDYFGIA
ncbi:MAG: molybdopterin-guanine dinucleotide biosynthesis protein B [Lachnospiraceae bacterium]|nr:molybdopterin-guanine dinucleotide biosynthesis protein B [Lachnospiraceae bacterium]